MTMTRQLTEDQWNRLYYKYSHVGCPACQYEDNCAHPGRCADNGRCLGLGPSPFVKVSDGEQERTADK